MSSSPLDALAADIITLAERCGATIVTAESCTGGQLAAVLARAPGAGRCLQGGFVTYTKDMKQAALGVPGDLLRDKTAVCEEVALAMAEGALERAPASIAVAITGVAGPEPDEDGNPVGLVYYAVAHRDGGLRRHVTSQVVRLDCGDREREQILNQAMAEALTLLRSLCFAGERV